MFFLGGGRGDPFISDGTFLAGVYPQRYTVSKKNWKKKLFFL